MIKIATHKLVARKRTELVDLSKTRVLVLMPGEFHTAMAVGSDDEDNPGFLEILGLLTGDGLPVEGFLIPYLDRPGGVTAFPLQTPAGPLH